jgi:hypothetical protein
MAWDFVDKTKGNQRHMQPAQSSGLSEHTHLPDLRFAPKTRQIDIAPVFPPAWNSE